MVENTGNIKVKTQVLGMVQTNCYIVSNPKTKQAVIIDPADKANSIKESIELDGLTVVGILLTHGHFDHILASNDLASYYQVKIYASEHEKELLADPNQNCSAGIGRSVSLLLEDKLMDGDVLELADFSIKAIHTPGHTAGGTCYYFVNHGIIFSGDTLFLESVGRTDLPTGNGAKLVESIKSKLLILEETIVVYPGHGDATTIGYEKKNNPYLNEEDSWL